MNKTQKYSDRAGTDGRVLRAKATTNDTMSMPRTAFRITVLAFVFAVGVIVFASSASAGGAPPAPDATPGTLNVSLTDGAGTANATWAINENSETVNLTDGTVTDASVANLPNFPANTTKAIEFAVSNATATNDTVVVGDGTFNGTVNVTNDATTLIDNSANTTAINGSGNNEAIFVNAVGLSITGFNNITNPVGVFNRNGFNVSTGASNVDLTDNTITKTIGDGVFADSVTDLTVTNSTITDASGGGIQSESSDIVVTGTTIRRVSFPGGIRVLDGSARVEDTLVNDSNQGATFATQGVVTRNVTTTHNTNGGLGARRSNQIHTNVTSTNNGQEGVLVSVATTITNVTIQGEGTMIRDNEQDGVEVTGGGTVEATVRNATVRDNALWDLSVNNGQTLTAENVDIGSSTSSNTEVSIASSEDFQLKSVSSPPADPSGEQNIGRYVDATNTSASGFLNITFKYEDSDVSGVNNTTLDVWKNNGTWTELGTGPGTDAAANEIQFNVTNVGSVFAPLANTGVSGAPGAGGECVDPRDLSRGQEGQECPTDRGISRGGSRDELDRNTGRNSDTSRRDRGRRDRGRSR